MVNSARRRDVTGSAKKSFAHKITAARANNAERREREDEQRLTSSTLKDYLHSLFVHVFGTTSSFVSGAERDSAYTPLNSIAFKLFLICRFCSAMMSNINDCDETFNYWEPLHFVIFGKGFQTWEYSPQYALRSYAFIWLYGWVVWLFQQVLESRLVVFFVLRLTMAFCCAFCELLFYRAVTKVYGCSVARLLLIFLAFSPGMFSASVAFLPSSFCMNMTMLSTAAVLLSKNFLAVFSVASSVLLAWPFSAITGLPIALDILFFQKKVKQFVVYSVLSFCIIMSFMSSLDFYYYETFVVAPFNIVMYNVFTSHGPDLYGTESVSFYLKNGFLNMAVAFVLSFALIPLLCIHYLVKSKCLNSVFPRKWLPLLSLFLWFAVFFLQAHKEERFLAPVYPLIALAGALSVQLASKLVHQLTSGAGTNRVLSLFNFGCMLVHVILGVSRITAQFVGFHAHMDVYGDFHIWSEQTATEEKFFGSQNSVLCIGREWHRFPSSFFLPDNFTLEFIRSEFKGQLPAHYLENVEKPSAVVHHHFNDMNKEEGSRYVEIATCNYLLDSLIPSGSELEPLYGASLDKWKPVVAREILNPRASHPLCRAFYLPVLSQWCTRYSSYLILQSVVT